MQSLRLALPKGRIQQGVCSLLADAGIRIEQETRAYRPAISWPGVDAKILKPQSVVAMLAHGSRDLGFAGRDWVEELGADVVELLDTGLDPVRVVAAAPDGAWPGGRVVVASEYERLTKRWIETGRRNAVWVRSFGATEVYPPEDADAIVDNTATGATLRANGLDVVDVLLESSTRLYANRKAMEDPGKRERAQDLVLLLRSVLEARDRAMVEVNVSAERLEAVLEALPSMRRPTVARLDAKEGFAVRAAVPRRTLPALLLDVKARGGTDIVVSAMEQVVA